jgi:hypothetical protein
VRPAVDWRATLHEPELYRGGDARMKGLWNRKREQRSPSGNNGPDVQNTSNRAAPIFPNPDKPAFLTPDGKPRYGAEEPYHFERFDEFRSFGDILNSWRDSTPFRLQELLETKITYRKEELDLGPNYGHRYDIYHFQSRVGLLQIVASRVVMRAGGSTWNRTVPIATYL